MHLFIAEKPSLGRAVRTWHSKRQQNPRYL